LALLLLGIGVSAVAGGQEWTRFRGPNGQGISDATTIPVRWTERDYNWRVKLPAGGHSSPVIWAGQVFLTCEEPASPGGILLALDVQTGDLRWRKTYPLTRYRFHDDNSYAVATPVVDADHVYVRWQTSEEPSLAALAHTGTEVWRRDFPGVYSRFGPGPSPMTVDGIVVFAHEHRANDRGHHSAWIAVDRRTGSTRWTTPRRNSEISYSTPCVYRPMGGQAQLIFTSEAHGITSVEPATGAVIWEVSDALPARAVSSPVIAGDLLIGTCGKGGAGRQLTAVRAPSDSDHRKAEPAYTCTGRSAPYVPTSLAKDGLLFTFHDQGHVSCLRLEDGQSLWSERPAGRYYGSPVWADGRLYCIDRDGRVVVLKAGREYERLAVNALGETSQATPAIADERMYLRTYSHLICLGGQR
jgi:outer membrane protein assembly factor BamB